MAAVVVGFPVAPLVLGRGRNLLGSDVAANSAGVRFDTAFGVRRLGRDLAFVPNTLLAFAFSAVAVTVVAAVAVGFPVAPLMLVNKLALLGMCRVVCADALFYVCILRGLPLAPCMSNRGDLLGVGARFHGTARNDAGVSNHAGLGTGRLGRHDALVINALDTPLLTGTRETLARSEVHILVFLRFAVPDAAPAPLAPIVLFINGNAAADFAVDVVMNAVFRVSPHVVAVVVFLARVILVNIFTAIRARNPMPKLGIVGVGDTLALRINVMSADIVFRTAVHRAVAHVSLIVLLAPRAVNMLVPALARVRAVQIDRDLRSYGLFPIAVRGHPEMLFVTVDQKTKRMLQLAVVVEAVERLGIHHDRVVGEGFVKVRIPDRLDIVAEQNAPHAAVALFIRHLIKMVVHHHHRTDPEIGYTENKIVFVVLLGRAVAVILLVQLVVGNDALHHKFQSTHVLDGDAAVCVGCDGNRVQQARAGHVAACVLHFQFKQVLLDLHLVQHAVQRFFAPKTVHAHRVRNAVAVQILLQNVRNTVLILVDQKDIPHAVLVDIRAHDVQRLLEHVVFQTAVAVIDLRDRDKGRAGLDRRKLIVRCDPGIHGDLSAAMVARGIAVDVIQGRQNGLMSVRVRTSFVRKIAAAVHTVPIFLAALVHAGGRNVLGILGRNVIAGRGVKITAHVKHRLFSIFQSVKFFRIIAHRKAAAAIRQHAVYVAAVVVPIVVRLIKISASAARGVPERTAVAVCFVTVIIIDRAEPRTAVILKRDAQRKHDAAVQIQCLSAVVRERIRLILQHADACTVGNIRKRIGFFVPIRRNIDRGNRVERLVVADLTGVRGRIKPAVSPNDVQKRHAVQIVKILLGKQAVRLALRSHGNRNFHTLLFFLIRQACRHRNHTDQHDHAQQ